MRSRLLTELGPQQVLDGLATCRPDAHALSAGSGESLVTQQNSGDGPACCWPSRLHGYPQMQPRSPRGIWRPAGSQESHLLGSHLQDINSLEDFTSFYIHHRHHPHCTHLYGLYSLPGMNLSVFLKGKGSIILSLRMKKQAQKC